MSENKIQEKIDGASPDSGEAFASRRRVIKGLASAVPAILTLTSGAELAASSALQCIEKQSPPTMVERCLEGESNDVGPPSDGWLRIYESKDLGGVNKHLNDDPDKFDSCLAYVDQSGNIFTDEEQGRNPVTISCYNSFAFSTPAVRGRR